MKGLIILRTSNINKSGRCAHDPQVTSNKVSKAYVIRPKRTYKIYDFDERLNFSKLYEEKLHRIVIKELKTKMITKSTLEQDKLGVDFYHDTHKVEYKIRSKDYEDVQLEIWSSMYDKPGWAIDYKKQSDYICFYWIDTDRHLLLDYNKLRKLTQRNYKKWITIYKTAIQHNKDYDSQCVFVPVSVLEGCR